MKKLLSIMLLVMSVLVVNAQDKKAPTATDAKAPAAAASMVKVADLPKAITDNIAKDYPGYMIKEAMNETGTTGQEYKVVVAKGSSTETLLYDKDGKFLKKVSSKSTTTEKPKK